MSVLLAACLGVASFCILSLLMAACSRTMRLHAEKETSNGLRDALNKARAELAALGFERLRATRDYEQTLDDLRDFAHELVRCEDALKGMVKSRNAARASCAEAADAADQWQREATKVSGMAMRDASHSVDRLSAETLKAEAYRASLVHIAGVVLAGDDALRADVDEMLGES